MTGWAPAVIPLATAVAVLLWGPGRADHRVAAATSGSPGTRVRLAGNRVRGPVAAVAGIVVATLVGGVSMAVAVGIIAGLLGWRRRGRDRRDAADRRRDDLLTALSLMIAELAVGAPPARACSAAATEMAAARAGPGEVADALAVLAGRAELGGGVPDAVGLAESGDTSWVRIAVAWQTSDTHGLSLADLLEALRADLLARKAFIERTRAGLAGPRATATVLAVLPLLGIALGQATGARPLQTLTGGGLGGILLVIGTALVAAGMIWSDRITDKVLTR
ncbi:type II secretion system protein F [Gordonia desulfuricans]|uniref:Type II secretion system protein F n=1 Tax=Gordonia desulfuricans TaxID=89051 RepID=A0A7K3LN18_9ACTN|nr:type II secretion system F family protein [Gordonia desulfuricans]NDK89629.1 type II secretion system protein F [Gordonia desulfuricans]